MLSGNFGEIEVGFALTISCGSSIEPNNPLELRPTGENAGIPTKLRCGPQLSGSVMPFTDLPRSKWR